MKEGKAKKGIVKWIILVVIIAIIAGVCLWYFLYKKPHDEAVKDFNQATEAVTEKNNELDHTIETVQAVIDSNEPPYDESTLTAASTAISDAQSSKRVIPELPDKTEEIKQAAEALKEPLDYTPAITNIMDAKTTLENSIQQMRQITNPSGDFVIQRIQGIDGITGVQAATEDHDPNDNLNKQGGYTAAIYFSLSLINQDEIIGTDIVDKGTQGGGCIEVYANVEDAEKRNTYLSAFDGAGMLNPGSHTVLGTIVIRTSDKLTATQQNEFTQKISDKLLELQ
ncbi:hypothetical protein GCM10008922_11490 [Faecalicatena contorta]|uniref:hypothetical protein n=1 Tax=Faecalicatena contorta TaxID=39482 RepID=UPI002ECF8D08|nr:hypothetical protein [Muricomes sp.]